MPKKLEATLSVASIKQLQKELEKYKSGLEDKCKQLVERLSEIGIEIAEVKIKESPLGHHVTIKSTMSKEQAGYKAVLAATGDIKKSEGYEDFNTLLAIEFGAGIYHNKKPNPNADEFGMGVGTFPGQIHAFEDGWYYWDEIAEQWRYTHGVKATMPMYNADMAIVQNFIKEAKDIFGK